MNKTIYLLSIGLLILLCLLAVFQGTRYIASPVAVFQLASLANVFMPFVISGLLVVFLTIRFADVWRGRTDVSASLTRPAARAAQTAGKVLLWIFYALFAVALFFLILAKGQLGGEISFLFGPLFRTLPAGLILFELGRILDGVDTLE